MIIRQTISDSAILRVSVDTLVAEHGRWQVFKSAVVALVRARRPVKPLCTTQLPNSIRRDIGLSPIVDPPEATHWHFR